MSQSARRTLTTVMWITIVIAGCSMIALATHLIGLPDQDLALWRLLTAVLVIAAVFLVGVHIITAGQGKIQTRLALLDLRLTRRLATMDDEPTVRIVRSITATTVGTAAVAAPPGTYADGYLDGITAHDNIVGGDDAKVIPLRPATPHPAH